MSNVELARFLAHCMYQLACMILYYQFGDRAKADKCQSDFRKTLETLDTLDAGTKEGE